MNPTTLAIRNLADWCDRHAIYEFHVSVRAGQVMQVQVDPPDFDRLAPKLALLRARMVGCNRHRYGSLDGLDVVACELNAAHVHGSEGSDTHPPAGTDNSLVAGRGAGRPLPSTTLPAPEGATVASEHPSPPPEPT